MDKRKIADSILNIAESIESGVFKGDIKIAVSNFGSELGEENINEAIRGAKSDLFDIVVVGTPVDGFESYEACGDAEVAETLSKLFEEGTIQAAVAMHYPFPIGVSTVGKVVTPAKGKEMFVATTTGTTDVVRTKAMVLNAINGIIVAKANGIENPTVGILNIEAAVIVEKKLKELQDNGFDINFAQSERSDGGSLLRGNDLVAGTPDVMVMDSLTGNVVMKTLSTYTTGGFYETTGYGYGPGIGQGYDTPVFIISRASGSPLVKNAIQFAYESAKGNIVEISKEVYGQAKKAGLEEILESLEPKAVAEEKEVEMPAQEIVTASVEGIDILEIEDAKHAVWAAGIYAESAMGCTGPIILVSDENLDKAKEVLADSGHI